MPRLLMSIILCTLLFTYTTYSGILRKYKDGISIDSLVEKWRPTNYETVKALLEKEKIVYKEEEDYGCSFIYSEYMITLHFNKVYYKGLYIGGGFLFFGHTNRQKVRYPLLCFRIEMPHSSNVKEKPKVNDIKTCYRLLNNLFTKVFENSVDSTDTSLSDKWYQEQPIDSIMNDYETGRYYPDESLAINDNGGKKGVNHRWHGRVNRSNIYVFLFLNRSTPLEFQIGTIRSLR